MKSSNDYLAEKVQELELSERTANASFNYWRNKAVALMQEKGMTTEQIAKEFEIAIKNGFYS